VLAPDKFKGSLDAPAVAESLAEGIREGLPDASLVLRPIADGGEGTVDCAVGAGFDQVLVKARGPFGEPGEARIAVRGGHAVIELAEICGWPRRPDGEQAPLEADTRGVGDAVLAALDRGCRRLTIGVGGSLSSDGGLGFARALGVRALGPDGAEIGYGGGALLGLRRLDVSGLDPRLCETELMLATDVDSPLLGPRGAARLFAPQKGAGGRETVLLEEGLSHLADHVEVTAGRGLRDMPGAGAAGGVAVAAVGLLGAEITAGAELFAALMRLEELVRDADLVITGEGRWDEQTLGGKGPMHVAAVARSAGRPVLVVAGAIEVDATALRSAGVAHALALGQIEPDAQICMTQAASLLVEAGRLLRPQILLHARPRGDGNA
jgi:glycerate 2-kinase